MAIPLVTSPGGTHAKVQPENRKMAGCRTPRDHAMSNQQNITAVNPVQEPERETGGRDGANEHVACCLVTAGLPESHSTQRQSEGGGWMDGGGR